MLVVTSLHAQSPRNLPHYSAAKAGQAMLVKELGARPGPHGIRVNAIVPGAIPGGGFQAPPGMTEKIPLRRSARPPRWRRWPSRCFSERFGAYVPALRSSSTAASRCIIGSIRRHERYLVRQQDVKPYSPANHTGTRNFRLIGPETWARSRWKSWWASFERGQGGAAALAQGDRAGVLPARRQRARRSRGQKFEMKPGEACFFPATRCIC